MEEYTVKQLKEHIRQPYAWPGGYEIIFIASDGETLCHNCARENFKEIIWSMKNRVNDGWRVVGIGILGNTIESTEESPLYCAHCYKTWEE
jgi:hypothetical protein